MKNPKTFGRITVADDGWWFGEKKATPAEAACYDAACFCVDRDTLYFAIPTGWNSGNSAMDKALRIRNYVRRTYEWVP